MRTLLSVVAALALAVGVSADQTPKATLGPAGHQGTGETGSITPPQPVNPGDPLYDHLDIVDNQTYNDGFACLMGGENVFGQLYDVQVATIVDSPADCELSDCTWDDLTYYGATSPIANVEVFAGGCVPSNSAFSGATGIPCSHSTFSDTVFGLLGIRHTAACDGFAIGIGAGLNGVLLQKREPDDWGFTAMQYTTYGCDTVERDGPGGVGVYGFTSWTPSTGWYGQPSASSALITAKCGPPKPRCIYQVNKVKNLATLCGVVCDSCPYVRGDLVCTNECPNGGADCRTRLKGFNACGNGGVCKVIADLVGCDLPPRNCKRCR